MEYFSRKCVILITAGLFAVPAWGVQKSVKAIPSVEAEKQVIRKFYVRYLGLNQSKPVPKKLVRDGQKMLSRVFLDWINLDADLCDLKAKDEICGWGADGDVFLDAQDYGPNLSFSKSSFTISEVPSKSGISPQLEVNFNLFPGEKDPEHRNQRTIRFVIRLEEGRWVIDDILYASDQFRSSVEKLRKEVALLESQR